jgi:thioredoxin reductase (NADPH)
MRRNTLFDCAIIGAGPAGLSAAIHLRLHEKNFIWFGSKSIAGAELMDKLAAHAQALDLVSMDKVVSQIMPTRQGFTLLADNDLFQAKTLIVAIGAVTYSVLPGETELVGKGVSYCATCDGFLYKGKIIGIVCEDKRFENEITYLSELAGGVFLFPSYRDCTIQRENVLIMKEEISSVNGGKKLESITLANGTALLIDGLFCMRASIAPATLLPGLSVEEGMILVDRAMSTNIPGCFACGDCTGEPHQLIKAVREENVAAHSAIRYLSEEGGE